MAASAAAAGSQHVKPSAVGHRKLAVCRATAVITSAMVRWATTIAARAVATTTFTGMEACVCASLRHTAAEAMLASLASSAYSNDKRVDLGAAA